MNIKTWVQQVNDWCRRNKVISSPDIEVLDSGGGMKLRIREDLGGGGGGESDDDDKLKSVTICKILGGNSGAYSVEMYGNGINQPSTGSGIMHLLNVSVSSSVPSGTWCIAVNSSITEIPED